MARRLPREAAGRDLESNAESQSCAAAAARPREIGRAGVVKVVDEWRWGARVVGEDGGRDEESVSKGRREPPLLGISRKSVLSLHSDSDIVSSMS